MDAKAELLRAKNLLLQARQTHDPTERRRLENEADSIRRAVSAAVYEGKAGPAPTTEEAYGMMVE